MATATYTDKQAATTRPPWLYLPTRHGRNPQVKTPLPCSLAPQPSREVDENSPPGTAVGKPVTAGDAGDILTYSSK